MSKKALLIGINYYDTPYELSGCINDIENVENELKNHGFTSIVKLCDDKFHPAPTAENIRYAMDKLILESNSGDFLVIHYSGHGTHIQDTDGDELDGRDECICPISGGNLDDSEVIKDDELNERLVKQLPDGVKLRIMFDCCHSGTILDLPYRWKNESEFIIEERLQYNDKDVIMISGCLDEQTSADAWIEESKTNQGALTWAWLKTLKFAQKQLPKMTWEELLQKMRSILAKDGYDQIPQISMCNKNSLKQPIDFQC